MRIAIKMDRTSGQIKQDGIRCNTDHGDMMQHCVTVIGGDAMWNLLTNWHKIDAPFEALSDDCFPP